ncbi:hypothetical protein BDV96DRAFT_688094 [Lophiotrema nucula]|uniref:Alcohol acetyltransferase n=1 Tax=Lophiotrema nucula TaxID=690887 RepID=A0A6A5Z6C4_9PLEO|nr:hypothetical protein BDV96DRAFT_688094 [Lophiotrema nucula]
MSPSDHFLRYASPMELRFVARENFNIYHAVIVGAIYSFPATFNLLDASSYFLPLQACLLEHKYLSIVVGDAHTDKAFYRHVERIDLEQHVSIVEGDNAKDESSSIEGIFRSHLDKPFPPGSPPWKIAVLPLSDSRAVIAFCYSHTVGDGATGAAFHRTFLKAYNKPGAGAAPQAVISKIVDVPERQLPLPFDTPQRLPISWSYLLAPFLGAFLPGWIGKLLGLRASVSAVDKGTWTGSKVQFEESKGCQSQVVLREIPAPILANALKLARQNQAKLTAVLQELIARALSQVLPDTARVTNLVCQTAINMRSACGIPNDEMGNAVSGHYSTHLLKGLSPAFDESSWASAHANTKALELTAARLQDQPTGLLRYLPSVRKWTLSKLGQPRDCSFEVSNIGAQAFPHALIDDKANITKMFFGQPGHATSAPLAFLFVSVKGGGLVYTVTWPSGALALAQEENEEDFVNEVCGTLEDEMASLR